MLEARHGLHRLKQHDPHVAEEGREDLLIVVDAAEAMNLLGAAILWAAHGDTDHFHLHMMFVTVDPATGGALPFGQEPDGRAGYKEAMQRAIARIEHAQQLQAETGARYEVVGDEVKRKPAPALAAEPATRKRAPLRQEVLDWEERSGFASFTRVAQEVAGPILDDAISWPQLHAALAPHGIGVRREVNGGELHAGDEHVKLSNVDRRHSWSQLIKPDRLGPYEEPVGVTPAVHEPRVIDPDKARRWLARSDQLRAVGERVDQRVATLLAARDAALQDVNDQLSAYQADAAGFDGDPRLTRDLSTAWPRLRASARAAINSAFSGRIEAVRALRHAAAGSDELDRIDLDVLGAPDVGIASWFSDPGSPSLIALDGFEAERHGEVVRYWSEADRHRPDQPALVDDGAIIWVNDRSDRAVEAALTLAQTRFGGVAVFGDAAYLRQCKQVATRLGIELETITVAEARRRARRVNGDRAAARRRAVEDVTGRVESAVKRRRAWARAYRRAGSVDDPTIIDGPPSTAHVPHHRDIPTECRGATAESRTTKPLGSPMISVEPVRPRALPDQGVGR